MDYNYNLHKETREELAKFEAKENRKYELGSDRVDDLPTLPGELTFAQKAKRRKSSLMLGKFRNMPIVDHVALRQVISFRYLAKKFKKLKLGIKYFKSSNLSSLYYYHCNMKNG